MIFSQALGENDEYKRLQKISQGIKEVSLQLRNMQTVTDHTVLKSMICSFPFQKASIELLMSAFFDYFRNKFFLAAFYQALQEIGQLQEYREFLAQRSARNAKITVNENFNKIIEQQQKQGHIPFAKDVIEQLLLSKRFACSYLKRFFNLAIELNYDLEEMSAIFRTFIVHTRSQKFQQVLIEQFQECKNTIFHDYPWKNKYDQELDDFCSSWNIEVTPSWVLERKKSLTSFNYISSDKYIKEEDEYITPASKVESVAECVEIVQRILCKPIEMIGQHDLQQMHNIENMEILIKFIIHPNEVELIDDWSLLYQKQDFECEPGVLKLPGTKLDYLFIARSYKSLEFLTQKLNALMFYHKVLEIAPTIFKQIDESLKSKTIQFNLNHLAILIDQLLQICPRLSFASIIQYNFLFSLLNYIDNSFIKSLLIDIIDINIDKYKIGLSIQEEIWKYLKESEWIDYLWSKMFDMSKENKNKGYEIKSEIIQDIIKIISKNKDKQKDIDIIRVNALDEFIGPIGVQTGQEHDVEEQINYPENLSYQQIIVQDVDDIRGYLDERRRPKLNLPSSRKQSRNTESQVTNNRSSTIQHHRNQSSLLPALPNINTPKSVQKKFSESQLIFSDTKSKRDSIPDKSEKAGTKKLPSVWNGKTQNSRLSIASDNGFSSSKLISIYPSASTKSIPSQFEIELQNFTYNTQNFDNYLDFLENIIKCVKLHKQFKISKDDKLCDKFFAKNLVISIVSVYLQGAHNTKEVNIQYGNIFNMILELALLYGNNEQIENLKDVVLMFIEFLNKIIINSFKYQTEQQQLSLGEHTLFKTLFQSLSLFESYDASKQLKNIYRFYNESVVHIFIIFFFKSQQNSIYQHDFAKFIHLIFQRAPPFFLQHILFNIGLVSSLSNAYNIFYANGFKSHSFNESLYYYLQEIVKSILKNLQTRNLQMILSSLEPLDSWKSIMKMLNPNERIKDKKLKTDETELGKSFINQVSSSRSLLVPEHKPSISLATSNIKKLSLKQPNLQKTSARLSPIPQKPSSRQPSASQLVF